MSEFFLRPYNPSNEGEEGCVYTRLLRSFRQEGKHALDTDYTSFFEGHRAVITGLLTRGASVTVASPTGEPSIVAGFMIHEPGVLHYVYTHDQYRRAGVAMTLLTSTSPMPKLFTHRTRSWSHLERRLGPMSWAPYLIAWPLKVDRWTDEVAERRRLAERKQLHRSRMEQGEQSK